ncbi:acyltransferase family protein [Brevundimonas subvibrioides]|uniref:acyltransferase family protein n=1 Tax=Brevundimonas subvibrioides TaxID=74313 RepID=UPI00315CA2E2
MQRHNAVEWLRVVSALGIVWFHAGVPGSQWGYAGLVVFLLLSLMFEAGPNHAKIQPLKTRAARLLVPWAFWWAVYAGLNIVQQQPIVDADNGLIAGVLTGPSAHLWYLPFAFVVLAVFGALKSRTPLSALALGSAVAAVVLICGIPLWRPISLGAGFPFAQWAHATTPVLIGILVGCCLRSRGVWILSAPVIAALVWACLRPFPDVASVYLLALGLTVGAILFPRATANRLPSAERISGAMMGVYLVHPLALFVVRPLTEMAPPVGVIAAFGISMLGVLLAQWIAPWPSSLVLGTPMSKGRGMSKVALG